MNLGKAFAACRVLSLRDVMARFSFSPGYSHVRCPFPAHGATGRTPSFKYYPNTDSFFCWGCKRGGGSVEFVSGLLSINSGEAALKLVQMFDLKISASALQQSLSIIADKAGDVSSFQIVQKVVSLNSSNPSSTDRLRVIEELYSMFTE